MKLLQFPREFIRLIPSPRTFAPLALILGLSGLGLTFPHSASAGPVDGTATVESDTRYGLFGWLDHRSGYGKGVFPEPFLVDDSDLEVNELRFDWLHTANHSFHDNAFKAEIEKGFGPLTVEVEVPFERISESGKITQGTDNVDVGARVPFYQYVGRDGFVDSTVGVAIEIGIPTHSSLSKNTEIVPKLFNDQGR